MIGLNRDKSNKNSIRRGKGKGGEKTGQRKEDKEDRQLK